MPLDSTGNPTKNPDDTYIRGKYKTEVYRYNASKLAILFRSGTTSKNIIRKLKILGVELKPFIIGDNESVYLFSEEYIDIVDTLLVFRRKGANISPKSIRTTRLLLKQKTKIDIN